MSYLKVALGAAALTVSLGVWVGAQRDQAAERRSCQSNLKQLSTALLMYMQDYDERFPPADRWTPNLQPYIKNNSVYKCPSDPKPHGYAMNKNLSRGSLADVERPAEITALFESNLHRPSANGTATAVAKPPRHMGGNNYAFIDGHVKWLDRPPPFGKPLPQPKSKPPSRTRR
jgi:prepilin-type processing-associated H-X9-DG protein